MSINIGIIGAGPTGLGAAWRLQEQGHETFLMVDKNPFFGGLATSFHDEKGFTWDFAVHVAHSHYHYFDKLMDTLLPDGFYEHIRMSWVWEYNRFIPYPFQNNIHRLPKPYLWDCVQGLLELKNQPSPKDKHHFKDWILSIFGEGIGRHFLLPYNEKIWTVPTEKMGYQWTGERVPQVDFERVIKNIIYNQDDVGWGPNATFYFPKKGGTGAIWNAMGNRISKDKVKLNTCLDHIDTNTQQLHFNQGSPYTYDKLISTMPLPRLARLLNDKTLIALTEKLVYTHVQVLGLAMNYPMPQELKDKTWLYCPEESCVFYRVTPFSNFSPAHVPDPNQWCSFLIEVATPCDQPMHDKSTLEKNILHDLQQCGLLDTEKPYHTYFMESEYGYPVPTVERDNILEEIHPILERYNIMSRGRFGGWKYEVANMDHSVMQGVEAVNKLLLNEDEVTLFHPNKVNAGKQ